MTEITIKEIPVQILTVPPGSVIVLRVPDNFTDEMAHWVMQPIKEALDQAGLDILVTVLCESVSITVLR